MSRVFCTVNRTNSVCLKKLMQKENKLGRRQLQYSAPCYRNSRLPRYDNDHILCQFDDGNCQRKLRITRPHVQTGETPWECSTQSSLSEVVVMVDRLSEHETGNQFYWNPPQRRLGSSSPFDRGSLARRKPEAILTHWYPRRALISGTHGLLGWIREHGSLPHQSRTMQNIYTWNGNDMESEHILSRLKCPVCNSDNFKSIFKRRYHETLSSKHMEVAYQGNADTGFLGGIDFEIV